MLENHNINSGEEYADILISTISEIPPLNVSEAEILEYWFVEIRKLCIEKYYSYIIGNEETFILDDVELDNAYRLAVEKMVGDSLQDLSEKGLLNISIDDNGEILYGLNEEGKKEAEKFNNE
jgi:hypothetical protein